MPRSLIYLLLALGTVAGICALLWHNGFHPIGHPADNETDRRLATAAVERFHQLFNDGQFETIWREASPSFVRSAGEGQIVSMMRQTRDAFGRIEQADFVSASNTPGGNLTLVYRARCEKRPALETSTWQSDGHTAALVSYQLDRATPEAPSPPATK